MKPSPAARYLLRFDDICPTMDWTVWQEIEPVLIRNRFRPILAVVPDNRDPCLKVRPPVPDFWDRVRAWQDLGWTIALHGFEHRYVTRNAGIAAIRKKSEFAGLPAEVQREKLRRGMAAFERERIRSRVWIAPGNTFDATTVSVLPEFGIDVISAGYFHAPHVCSRRMIWVPQQLHYFRPAPPGVWTVCYHPNKWSAPQLRKSIRDLYEYAGSIHSLEDILGRSAPGPSPVSSWFCGHPRISSFLIRLELKSWAWRNSGARHGQRIESNPCRS